jgi:hypothetical protein
MKRNQIETCRSVADRYKIKHYAGNELWQTTERVPHLKGADENTFQLILP